MSIRAAAPGDLAALAELESAAFPDPWSEAMLRGQLAHPHTLLLIAPRPAARVATVVAAGTIDAYACFLAAGDEAELLRIAVLPAERRRGLARRLLQGGLLRLQAAGVRSCHLEVRPANEPALALYRSLGFVVAGRRGNYYRDGSDALVLNLAL